VILLLLALLARPNLNETPGLVRPLSRAAICSTKWGLDRRHVSDSKKKRIAKAYGVRWADRGRYEFDHLVPRELGGSDDQRNIWPQPLAEARQLKDPRENALRRAVCAGTITLTAAQAEMRAWGKR
jgi:hypothetical protein